MSLSRIRIMALGTLAVAVTAMAGCSDDGSTTIIGSSSIPVITGLSTNAVLTNGQTTSGQTVRLEIRGDDFDKNAEVRLLAKAPATLDPNAANINSGVAGVNSAAFVRIPAANLEWQSQNRIDILTLPASPLAGTTQQGTVVIQVVNPGNVVNTDGTADGSGTSDELTYYADTGVQVTVAQAGPLTGAWTNIFPGQSGVEFEATITNMTLEPINTLTIPERALDFGTINPHALSYIIREPSSGTLAVGASTTVRFLAAFSNDLPEGAATASCSVSAVGASSGRSYTGTGGAAVTAGSTPTINTRGGNSAQQGAISAGAGATITINGVDNAAGAETVTALEGGVTIGAASTVNANTDLAAGVGTDQSGDPGTIANNAIRNALATTAAFNLAQTQATVLVGGTIDITNGAATSWTFTGNFPVVFRNVTIRYGVATSVTQPQNLTITTDSSVQFINCTIDLTDRRAVPVDASGSLVIDACNADNTATVDRIDIQSTTIKTHGVRALNGTFVATASGSVTIRTDDANAAESPIRITGSTINSFGAGMVTAAGLPGTGSTTAGSAISISTHSGAIAIDQASRLNSSGGDALAFTSVPGADAGAVTITAGGTAVDARDVIFDGRIDARGGDALNAAAGDAAAVTISGRKVSIGNAAGRPVLLANGGSNSVVGGMSLLTAAATLQNQAGQGGPAGNITIAQDGRLQIAAGSGLIAIGGGGDTQVATAAGGIITFGSGDLDDVTAEAVNQEVTMAGVADASGGWVRVTGTGGTAGRVLLNGNTDVTMSGVLLACGGSPARSSNQTSPVGGNNNGGAPNATQPQIQVRAGLNTSASPDIGLLSITGVISTRGGFCTTSTGVGGNGGNVLLGGESVNVSSTGKVVTDGGSCGDAGLAAGGDAGTITVGSGLENAVIGATGGNNGTPGADTTGLTMAGLLQADGGNGSRRSSTGQFAVNGNATTTVTVVWPSHGAVNGDLVSVTGAGAANVSAVALTVVDANSFTYPAAQAVPAGSVTGTVTLSFDGSAGNAHGDAGTIELRQDNVAKLALGGGTVRDHVSVTGQIFARTMSTGGGVINVFGARNAGDAADDSGNITISQTAVLTAGGTGATVLIDGEDVAVVTIAGKVTVDNDRLVTASVAGSLTVTVREDGTANTAGSIVVSSTGELLVAGGHPGTLTINNLGDGPLTLTPAFIRNEDQTVSSASNADGKGGLITIEGEGVVNHSAGEITARGTASGLGHGGEIRIAAKGATATSVLNLTGTGLLSVDAGGPNGWGGRLQVRANRVSGTAATDAAITIGGSYTLTADGSGLGGGGLPTANSLRNGLAGFTDGGIYVGGLDNAGAAVANQVVSIGTSTALTATGGTNTVRSNNGTPNNGCMGGVIVIGETNALGQLAINSGLNVSGGSNAGGPGGNGGTITVRGNGGSATLAIASTAGTTWTANGGASTYPQSVGGPAGTIGVLSTADGTVTFGAAAAQFSASLVGGGAPTVGGDGGVFDVTNTTWTAASRLTFVGASRISVGGGTGSIAGASGVVRLSAPVDATANISTTNLTVEPANGGTNPVQTLFVVD